MTYLILFLVSFSLTYFIKNYFISKLLLDIPNERSSHAIPTPNGGGIAIALSWFIGISYLYYIDDIDSKLYFVLLLGIVLSVISLVDDILKIGIKKRLVVHVVIAILSLIIIGGFNKIDFIYFTIENSIITNIFALLMIVWFINLFNFLDGIDGYAGSEVVFLGVAGYIIFGDSHFLVLIASVLGFLVWNWDKAKIFMGDSGSILLGYNIAIFTIFYANQESTNLWIWIILFSLFWIDATYTLIKRIKEGKNPTQAHKEHIYQKLVQRGLSHQKVVLYSIGLNIILFCLVYLAAVIL